MDILLLALTGILGMVRRELIKAFPFPCHRMPECSYWIMIILAFCIAGVSALDIQKNNG